MSTITKKLTSVALSTATVVWLSGFAMLVPVAHAQSVSDLQAQIQALLAQIAQLQTQLSTIAGGSSASSTSCNFTRNLTVGVTGEDVRCLQKYLNGAGYKVANSGAGSLGAESTYFGSLTQAAVAKWQAGNSVSPAAGYFGAISRAKYATLVVAAPPTTPGTVIPSASAGSRLTVRTAADQPAPGLFGESFASRPFTKLSLTASADGDIVVKSLLVERTGQGNDAVFSGIIALDDAGVRIGDAKTFGSDHRARLTGAFVVKAGQTRSITLAGDSDSDQNDYAGQLVSLSLVGADAGGAAVDAAYPMTGPLMTVNSTLSIGSVTVERGALDPGSGPTKEAGTKGYIFSSLKVTAGSNEDVSLKAISWNQSSSAATSDLANIVVVVDGTTYPTTISADGKYYTSVFGSGINILKGFNKEISIKGDILSGTNRGIDFDLYRYSDIKVTGLTYGYDLLPTDTVAGATSHTATDDNGSIGDENPNFDAYEVTIGNGTLSVEKATSVGSQNVAENLSDQVLGGFVTDVKGEEITVAAMNFDVSTVEAAGTGGSLDSNDITNIILVDESGRVVAGPVDGQAGGNNAIRFTDTVTYPVGRKVFTLKGKLGTDFEQNDQISASTTPTEWTNVKGVASSQTITPSGSTVTMNIMTLKTAALTVSVSADTASSSPDQNVVSGINGYTFLKIVLDASSAGEDIRTTSMNLRIQTIQPGNVADDMTNCQLWDNSTNVALNTGTNVVSPANGDATGATSADKSFILDSGLMIPKGTTKTLALKCNIIGGSTATRLGWSLVNAAGTVVSTGVTSGTSFTESINADNGRTVVINSAGTLALVTHSSSPTVAKLAQAGATDQTVAVFRLNASFEDVRLDQLGLQLATTTYSGSSSPSDLVRATLWDGSLQVGAVTFVNNFATATLSNFIVPKDQEKLLTVKVDVAPMDVTLSQAVPGHLVTVDYDAAWGDAPDDASNEGAQGGKGTGMSSGTSIYTAGSDSAVSGLRIVKSAPTLTKLAHPTGKFTGTSNQSLYRFKVEAPAGGNGVSLYKFTYNVATNTPGASATDPAFMAVTDFRAYCYSDSGFSSGSCGSSTGQLNYGGLLVASVDNASFDPDGDAANTEADRDVDVVILFNPVTASGSTAEAITIPAGETRYFELKADVLDATSSGTPTIAVTLLGDAAWTAVTCGDTGTERYADYVVVPCENKDGGTGTAAFTAEPADIDADADGDDFIWSPNSTNSSMSLNSASWLNGFLLSGLPSDSTSQDTLIKQ